MNTLVLVDDEENNLDALERIFRKNYKVFKFTKAKDALDFLQENQCTVIISDQRMPKMTGTEFFKQCEKRFPSCVRLLLTGYTDIDSVIAAINEGHVYRYIAKPWNNVELEQIVQQAVEYYNLRENLAQKNIELKAANEELQQLDKAKSNFMYLINHELKTPLTSISSYLQLLQESSLDSEQKIFTNGVQDGYDRLEKLVNNTLLIMAAQTGKLKLNLQTNSLNDVYFSARAKLETFRNEKEIKFSEVINAKNFKMDPRLIGQVIENLLHNAIKFSKPQSNITVQIHDKSFAIQNTSDKLDTQKISKYLETFYIDEDYKNHSNATGLGLSICQSILKLHDSRLNISTNKNQIEFSFHL